jgi:hypothetical protein
MARRKLLTPDERQALLGIPDDEESLIRHYTCRRKIAYRPRLVGGLITSSAMQSNFA